MGLSCALGRRQAYDLQMQLECSVRSSSSAAGVLNGSRRKLARM